MKTWVRQDSTGLLRVEMLIFHYELIRLKNRYHTYLNVFFDCYFGSIPQWKQWNRQRTIQSGKNDLQFDFFMDKALQIFSLCECYEQAILRNGCMMNRQSQMQGGDKEFETMISRIDYAARDTRNIWMLSPRVAFTTKKTKQVKCRPRRNGR
jgi:hypothetical protein